MTLINPTSLDPVSGEITVDTTAGGTQLLSACGTRRGILIINGAAAINMGKQGLTYGTNPVLAANQSVVLDGFIGELWAITSSGSSTLRIFTW